MTAPLLNISHMPVVVVELFSESLSDDGAPTYVAMVESNAQMVSEALG